MKEIQQTGFTRRPGDFGQSGFQISQHVDPREDSHIGSSYEKQIQEEPPGRQSWTLKLWTNKIQPGNFHVGTLI